ncbi:MAG: hypothetical protein LBK26_03180 [Rickettsiales bacterium]|nr:hypothetical protein [Rickettsiales bacterium]
MKYLTSFVAILVWITGYADAAPSRARPGSIAGAFVSNAQASNTAAAPAAAIVSASSKRYSPITNNELRVTLDENGNALLIDPANDNKFTIDADGNLQKQPDNPDDYIIPTLGVSVGTARRACLGIYADAHQAVFEEETYQCLIPVVAHNWSGVIKSGGQDVVAWAPMGNLLKCNANAFEQISAMRRTSQWVVPVMVAGSAGIGAGIGAIMDHNQKKKADALEASLTAATNAQFGAGVQIAVPISEIVTFEGKTYNVSLEAEMNALIGSLKDAQAKAIKLMNTCAAKAFKDLVSVEVNNSAKWGRIKITSNGQDCQGNGAENVEYCQFQNIHGNIVKMADCAKNDFELMGDFENKYVLKELHKNPTGEKFYYYGSADSVGFVGKGTCFFRDGQGSSEIREDATLAADAARARFLERLKSWDFIDSGLSGFLSGVTFGTSGGTNQTAMNDNILNYITVNMSNGKTFGNITNFGTCDDQAFKDMFGEEIGGWTGNANNAESIIFEAFGAIQGLEKALALLPDSAGWSKSGTLNNEIKNIEKDIMHTIDLTAELSAINSVITDEIDKKLRPKGFFQKNVGKGLLIGTGVGALAGLGYYFAEGASVFCNVGGLEQVKLDKVYSIPTFREYIVRNGYLK